MTSKRCPLCGRRLTPSIRSKDHFIPKALGGNGSAENTWTICRPCNTKKGSRPPNEREAAAFARVKRL